MKNFIKSLKHLPKIWAALSYSALLVFSLFLFFGRSIPEIRIASLLKVFPDFYKHVSNFSLTLIVFVSIGYIGLMVGLKLKHITIIGIVFGIINMIFEFFISILNTPDKTDAVYGVSSVILGLLFLYTVKKSGLQKNKL
ncbi:hypothetical protein EGM88_14005 [Aureibaculum marinum]|uniref:VanZ-like domain-containing protein n=1 Tax=Aureibaculum marinum TaxID=2487930 RepID=A0A3N4NE07_9FLAO|nr:hypothetical protein [Aureibaculum marinum]RPD93058.1 hypothetical protein EGM88_14005 [Aureibaculum marinum]